MINVSVILSTVFSIFAGSTVVFSNIKQNDPYTYYTSSYANCSDANHSIITVNSSNGLLDQKKIIAMERLDEIEKLPFNWNENDALPFSKKLIDKCREVLANLNVVPKIYPAANSSIQFEYYKSDGSLLEFNIFEDRITLFKKKEKDSNGKWIKNSYALDSEETISREVDAFYE